MLLTVLDLVGSLAFALSGATRATERRLDPFGIAFLAFVASTSGGIVRDVLIGTTPPLAIATWHYCAVACLAAAATWFARGAIARLAAPVAFFDALGLGVFAVVGTRHALEAGLSPLMAAMLGMVSAIGGGIGRDILTAQTPMVLQKEIYALAALLGGLIVAFGGMLGLADAITATVGAALATGLRLIALKKGWNLPVVGPGGAAAADEENDRGP
ncbi:MAG: trimeric intracellular cation channel family protein [Siculibacillus sp.]|nr:trimeric intracellular cation channel family protein [Siculibacillus sp.]